MSEIIFGLEFLIVINNDNHIQCNCLHQKNVAGVARATLETIRSSERNQDPCIVFRFPINLYLYSFLLLL